MAYRNCTASFLRLLAVTTIANLSFSALTAQEIRVDPENLGATDVSRGTDLGSSTLITNPTSPLNLGTDGLYVGGNDIGKLSLTNGAVMTSSGTHVGVNEDSVGSLTLFGAGTTFSTGGPFSMAAGRKSSATFNIGAGAAFDYTGTSPIEIGTGEASRASISVTGGANARIGTDITFGLSESLQSRSNLFVSGLGSIFETTGKIELGSSLDPAPAGNLVVSDGGQLSTQGSLSVLNGSSSIEVNTGGKLSASQIRVRSGQFLASGDATFVETDELVSQKNGTTMIRDSAWLKTRGLRGGSTSRFVLAKEGVIEVDGDFNLDNTTLQFLGGRMVVNGDRDFDGFTETDPSIGPLDDDSLLDSIDGKIGFLEDIEFTGNVNLQRELAVDGGRLFVGSISDSSMIDFRRGKFGITASDVEVGAGGTFGPTLQLYAGRDLTVSQSINVTNDGRVELNDALLTVGAIENRGMTTGRGTVVGNINNRTGGEVRLANADRIRVDGDISNEGMVRLMGGTLEVEGQFVNQAGGKVAGRGAMEAIFGLTNEGDMQFSGGDSDVIGAVTNRGSVELFGSSSVTFHGDVFSDSELAINDGSEAVFLGDFQLGSSSSLMMELGDRINPLLSVAGDFEIDGDLFLAFADGYAPEVGDKWLLANGGQLDGEFRNIFSADLASQYRFEIDQSDSSLSLSIVSVPEPATLPIAMLMVAGIIKRRRTS